MNGLLIYNKLRPWIQGLLLALAVYTLAMGGYTGYHASKLAAEGKIAPGTLTAKRVITERNAVRYEISFQFTAPYKEGVARVPGSQLVSKDTYETYQVGDRVPVRFLPSDPLWAEVSPGAYQAKFLNGISIGLFCLAGLILSVTIERFRRKKS